MLILGIDSSTQVNTIALVEDGILLAETVLNTHKNHSQRLMPMIDLLLNEAELTIGNLDGLAVSSGPGSFTGLRIGMTTAKAIAWSLQKPLAAIPSLDGLAFNAQAGTGIICPILNARRNQVYTSLYIAKKGQVKRIDDYMAIEPLPLIEMLQKRSEDIILVGDGIEEYGIIFKEHLGERLIIPNSPNILPRASQIAYLGWQRLLKGETDDAMGLSPQYIRKSEAEIKLQQRIMKTQDE